MQKVRSLILLVIIFLITSCINNNQATKKNSGTTITKPSQIIKTTSLNYQDKHLVEYNKNCKVKNGGCNTVELSYPVFDNSSLLNDTVTNWIFNYFHNDVKLSKNVAIELKRFSNDFFDSLSDNLDESVPNNSSMGFFIKIIKKDSLLIRFEKTEEISGGAHPYQITYFINWEIKRHREIKLSDILINGFDKNFNRIAKGNFLKNEKSNAVESTDSFFVNGDLPLNSNFEITPVGLNFHYLSEDNSQNCKDVLIHYNQIKQLLRPNTVITQYLK